MFQSQLPDFVRTPTEHRRSSATRQSGVSEMLRILLSLPADLIGSLVLSKLELPDIVRLDTALLVKECRSDLLAWYPSISSVSFDGLVNDERLTWLFQRNVRIGRLEVDWDEQLLQLIGEHIHLVVHGITLWVDYGNRALWEEFRPSPDVLCKVDELRIDGTVGLDAMLPFRQLKSLTYNGEVPGHYRACLIRTNPMLRELSVTALVERKSVLTKLELGGCDFTSHELQIIADACPLLTALNLQRFRGSGSAIESGAVAFVQRCPLLESIELYSKTFSPALLTTLLTHGLSLNSIHTDPGLLLSDAALAARPLACSPLRKLTCRWGVTTLGTVAGTRFRNAAGGNLLSGITELTLKGVNADSVHTLSEGLFLMRELRALSLSPTIALKSLHSDVLLAVAQGCSQLTKFSVHTEEPGDFVGRLALVLHRNPCLAEIKIQHALVLVRAQNSSNLRVPARSPHAHH